MLFLILSLTVYTLLVTELIIAGSSLDFCSDMPKLGPLNKFEKLSSGSYIDLPICSRFANGLSGSLLDDFDAILCRLKSVATPLILSFIIELRFSFT